MCACVRVRVCTCALVCVQACVRVRMCACVRVCMCACAWRVHVCASVRVHACACARSIPVCVLCGATQILSHCTPSSILRRLLRVCACVRADVWRVRACMPARICACASGMYTCTRMRGCACARVPKCAGAHVQGWRWAVQIYPNLVPLHFLMYPETSSTRVRMCACVRASVCTCAPARVCASRDA